MFVFVLHKDKILFNSQTQAIIFFTRGYDTRENIASGVHSVNYSFISLDLYLHKYKQISSISFMMVMK